MPSPVVVAITSAMDSAEQGSQVAGLAQARLADRVTGVDLRHMITAGLRGVGRVPLLRHYFSAEFAVT